MSDVGCCTSPTLSRLFSCTPPSQRHLPPRLPVPGSSVCGLISEHLILFSFSFPTAASAKASNAFLVCLSFCQSVCLSVYEWSSFPITMDDKETLSSSSQSREAQRREVASSSRITHSFLKTQPAPSVCLRLLLCIISKLAMTSSPKSRSRTVRHSDIQRATPSLINHSRTPVCIHCIHRQPWRSSLTQLVSQRNGEEGRRYK